MMMLLRDFGPYGILYVGLLLNIFPLFLTGILVVFPNVIIINPFIIAIIIIIIILNKTKKTYVPGFSPKYFTIWGSNMDTKHTTGKQITGN
jgi:hypothetical protein